MARVYQQSYKYKGKVCKSKTWYGRWKDETGKECQASLGETKLKAQTALGEKLKAVELAKRGILDPIEKHRKIPLLDHLKTWEEILRQTNGKVTAYNRAGRVRRILAGTGWKYVSDWTASSFQLWLSSRRTPKPMPALDPDQEWFSRVEIAALLGTKVHSVSCLMGDHDRQSKTKGGGPTKRFARQVVIDLLKNRTKGVGNNTSNHYLKDLKAFAAWMCSDDRIAKNPFEHIRGFNKELDQRRARQTLSLEQMQILFRVAAKSKENRMGLTGLERSFLYAIAASSGFRRSELSLIRVRHIITDECGQVIIQQPKADSKNRRGSMQPLPADAGQAMLRWIAEKEPDDFIWPRGDWTAKASVMLHADLVDAGLPYCIEGPDGPLWADFHCLRHSYIALLEHSGLTVREQMVLARHSDPNLTIKVYARAAAQRNSKIAVRKLPAILSPTSPAAAPGMSLAEKGQLTAWLQNSPEFAAQVHELAAKLGLAAQPLRIAGAPND